MSRFDTYHDTELTMRYCDIPRHVKRLTKNVLVIKMLNFSYITL